MLKVRGYTLIEVIVVIMIVAVLLSILIPSVLYMRKLAKKTSLTSQMNRIQQSMEHYQSEYQAAPAVYTHAELKGVSSDITQTENALFSLMGGLVYDANGNPPDIESLAVAVRTENATAYDSKTMGTGSVYRDDSGQFSRNGSFYRDTGSEMQRVTGTTGHDNYIYDLVDPVNGQPILIYTPAPYPLDSEGYARADSLIRPVSYDDSAIGSSANGYGLIWRRLNDDFVSAEALSSGNSIINQRDESMLSDACVMAGNPDHDATSALGASSNLAWFIQDWTQISSSSYYTGNPNQVLKYGRHQVTKGYFLISAGYHGVYFNKESNHETKFNKTYSHGYWSWNSGYTPYSTFQEEREHWFSQESDRLIFAHRYYGGTETGEGYAGRDSKYSGEPENKTGGSDGAYGLRSLNVLTENFDDLVKVGGEFDPSIE